MGSTGNQDQYLTVSLTTTLPQLSPASNTIYLSNRGSLPKGQLRVPPPGPFATRRGGEGTPPTRGGTLSINKPSRALKPVEIADSELRISGDTLLDLTAYETDRRGTQNVAPIALRRLWVDKGAMLTIKSSHRVVLIVNGDVEIAGTVESFAPTSLSRRTDT